MTQKMHKLFLTTCDLGEQKPVGANDCERCPRGSVVDRKSRVICAGVTKFFVAPCFFDMRSAATVADCENCHWGEVGDDRIRVFCSRL
ncbi:MAG: hypothetical protein WAS24_09230 [Thermoplasmata archaeon]|jgi:hypothetical protein